MKIRINNTDLYLRVLSLVIAIIFWIFAQQNMQVPNISEKEQYQRIMKDVVFKDLKEGTMITSPVPEVFVEISGSFWALNQKQDEILVYASLEKKSSGKHSVKVTVKAPEGINIIQYYPEEIDVRVEKKISKELQIEPLYTGSLALEYKIENIAIEPQKVTLSGPESIINLANKANILIDMSKTKPGQYKKDLPIHIKTKDDQTIKDLETDPQFAEVNWQVIRQEGEKVKVAVNLVEKNTDLDIKITPEEVLVFGNKNKIDTIYTEPVELNKLPYTGEIDLKAPAGVGIWPKKVQIRVEKKKAVEGEN